MSDGRAGAISRVARALSAARLDARAGGGGGGATLRACRAGAPRRLRGVLTAIRSGAVRRNDAAGACRAAPPGRRSVTFPGAWRRLIFVFDNKALVRWG